MDSLAKLLAAKEYQIVLVKTENDLSYSALLARLKAMIALDHVDDALALIAAHRNTFLQDRATLVLLHIHLLVDHQLFQEAEEALNYYDSLPYVSYEIEELIKSMREMVNQKRYQRGVEHYSDQRIIDILSKSTNEGEMLLVLRMLSERNLRPFLPTLAKLMTSKVNNNLKTFALLVLVEQRVQGEYLLVKDDITYHINPYELDAPFSSPTDEAIYDELSRQLRDPSLVEVAQKLLQCYALEIYPQTIAEDEQVPILGALILLAYRYMSQPCTFDFAGNALFQDVNLALIETLADEINETITRTPALNL